MEIKYKNELGKIVTYQQAQELDSYCKLYIESNSTQKEEIYIDGVVRTVRYKADNSQTDEDILALITNTYANIEDAQFAVDVVRIAEWNGYLVEDSVKYKFILSSRFKRFKMKALITQQGQVICRQSFNPENDQLVLDRGENDIYPRSTKVFYSDSNESLCYLYYKEDHSFDYASIPEHHEENIDSGTEENLLRLQNTVGIPEEWMAYYSTAVFYPEHGINTI